MNMWGASESTVKDDDPELIHPHHCMPQTVLCIRGTLLYVHLHAYCMGFANVYA